MSVAHSLAAGAAHIRTRWPLGPRTYTLVGRRGRAHTHSLTTLASAGRYRARLGHGEESNPHADQARPPGPAPALQPLISGCHFSATRAAPSHRISSRACRRSQTHTFPHGKLLVDSLSCFPTRSPVVKSRLSQRDALSHTPMLVVRCSNFPTRSLLVAPAALTSHQPRPRSCLAVRRLLPSASLIWSVSPTR